MSRVLISPQRLYMIKSVCQHSSLSIHLYFTVYINLS